MIIYNFIYVYTSICIYIYIHIKSAKPTGRRGSGPHPVSQQVQYSGVQGCGVKGCGV